MKALCFCERGSASRHEVAMQSASSIKAADEQSFWIKDTIWEMKCQKRRNVIRGSIGIN